MREMRSIIFGAGLASLALVTLVTLPPVAAQEAALIPPTEPHISIMGRVDATNPPRIRLGYPGITIRVAFEGSSSLSMRTITTTPNSYLDVTVDDGETRVLRLPQGESDVSLAEGLGEGRHTVTILHRTETWVGVVTVVGFRLAPAGRLFAPTPLPRRKMLFIGDSVTCGEGVDHAPGHTQGRPAGWDPAHSYGMLLARTFDAQAQLVCYGGRGLVRDWQGHQDTLQAPQFFELALPDAVGPLAWDHGLYIPDAVVVALGTNDFNLALGDFPDREEWVGAYVRFVQAIRGHYPEAQIFLTEGPIVNDPPDGTRPQKTILRSYIAETVARLVDPKVHAVESKHCPGDAGDAHPPAAAHMAIARDLEPVIRVAVGW